MNIPQPIQKRIYDRRYALKSGIDGIARTIMDSPAETERSWFDNRPTWDNWPNKGGNPFDNRPTWDNWANRR